MAERLTLAQPTDNIDDVLEVFYTWVSHQGDGRSLVVWDNWDDFEEEDNDIRKEVLSLYFILRTFAQLLITTRYLNVARTATFKIIRLEALLSSEARSFLAKDLGDENLIDLDMLVQRLGGIPLALNQAARYIRIVGISVADFVKKFDNIIVYSDAVDYSLSSLDRTWELTLTALERDHMPASQLLFLMCSLDPEFIPMDLIRYLCPAVSVTTADVVVL